MEIRKKIIVAIVIAAFFFCLNPFTRYYWAFGNSCFYGNMSWGIKSMLGGIRQWMASVRAVWNFVSFPIFSATSQLIFTFFLCSNILKLINAEKRKIVESYKASRYKHIVTSTGWKLDLLAVLFCKTLPLYFIKNTVNNHVFSSMSWHSISKYYYGCKFGSQKSGKGKNDSSLEASDVAIFLEIKS